jgi:hypothetical protein
MMEKIANTIVTPPPRDLYRYSKELNTSYVDIEIDFYREIYNEWDFSPLTNRDLDEDLMSYLEECAREINKKHNMAIVFHIPETLKDPEKEEKSKKGFANYFNYELRKQENKRHAVVSSAIASGLYGVIFLFLGTTLARYLETHELFAQVSFLAEGFFIGGWVLIWEMFNTAFFRSKDLFSKERVLQRLLAAEIIFNYRQPSSEKDSL